MVTTIAKAPKDTPQTVGLAKITPLMEARALQRFIYNRASQPKVTDAALATLARSWALLQDCIRVMRGIPDPGSLRPDLDPVQLMKAAKRARSRQPIQLGASTGSPFAGPEEVADEPAAGRPMPPEKPLTPATPEPTPEQPANQTTEPSADDGKESL